MGVSSSIQFRGMDQVMAAFINRDAECWSMWAGKQFLFKGFGEDTLQTILTALCENSGSNAIYTIRVYEDITDPKKIKSNTPDDGSFNFRLNEENMVNGSGLTVGQTYGLAGQLLELKNQIQEMKALPPAAVEPEEEEKTIGSVIMDVISNPSKAQQWAEIIRGLFAPATANFPAATVIRQTPAVMGNTTPVNAAPQNLDEKLERISAALDILGRNDPKICEHLEKLAEISTKKPVQFSSLLATLELF